MEQISISLITGFLGSGKTTLISNLLSKKDLVGVIVIVNDVASIGFDNVLLSTVGDEVILLSNGCLCCSIGDDLCSTLRNLLRRFRAGELPAFRHVVIETTGIADPIPIMRSIAADSVLASFYALDRVVTTVDAIYGFSQLANHPEANAQLAVADFIVITKAAEIDAGALGELTDQLSYINPIAEICSVGSPLTVCRMLARTRFSGLPANSATDRLKPRTAGSVGSLSHDITVACLMAEERIVWGKLVDWVEVLGARLGENLLRIKGILRLSDNNSPVFINGIQDTFYPPILLPKGPSVGEESQLVVIAKAIDSQEISRSFVAAVLD